MPEEPLEHQEIVRLLGKLKEETPDYPTELLEERKYSFMKQIVDLKISSEGPTGRGGTANSGKPGGSGAALGGGATFFGISLKAAFAIGAVIVLLTAAYLFRDQIVHFLAENEIISTEGIRCPSRGGYARRPGTRDADRRPDINFWGASLRKHGNASCARFGKWQSWRNAHPAWAGRTVQRYRLSDLCFTKRYGQL